MKRIIPLILCCLVICSCNEEKQNDKVVVNKVDCSQMMELKEDDAILIDVRTIVEYKAEHLDDAVNVPVENILEDITTVVDSKETKIILYCMSGTRSADAAQKLVDAGYKNVYDLGAMENCSN